MKRKTIRRFGAWVCFGAALGAATLVGGAALAVTATRPARPHVEFRLVAAAADPDTVELTLAEGRTLRLRRAVELDGADIQSAKAGKRDTGTLSTKAHENFVVLTLTAAGRERLQRTTAAHRYGDLAVLVDGGLVSVARILEPIADGRFELVGGFSDLEAVNLAARCNGR
jgi:preprotein translocase subunit SecD